MTAKFRWTCSYMGCSWYQVTDETGHYEAEFRRMAGDYELSIANGDDCRRDILASVGILHRSSSLPGQWEAGRGFEVPESTVAAFNAWRADERRGFVAQMKAAPERYGEIDEADPILFPPIVEARRGWYVHGKGWQSDAPTVYRCHDKAGAFLRYAKTEAEALGFLQSIGGGIYRNALHAFNCPVHAGEVAAIQRT